MIKASALYIVIVISLVIAVLCSSLIVTAYYYRAEYQMKFRYDQLETNLGSGINILLTSPDSAYVREGVFSLFNQDNDSVSLKVSRWGIYDVGIAKAIIQHDTLFKTFLIANAIDSTKWEVLYLVNEDKPLAISGKTMILGDVYLPKAGILQAFINNHGYEGDKRMILGKKSLSEKKLPEMDTIKLQALYDFLNESENATIMNDSVNQSFLQPTIFYNFKKQAQTLEHVNLKGNIVLHSDTTLTIDSTAKLENVMVFAKTIIVKKGFRGNCQLFAEDSISVKGNSRFEYPSCIGVIRLVPPKTNSQAAIFIGKNTTFSGVIFTYEKKPNDLRPLITICNKDTIKGQIYSQNALESKGDAEVVGNIFTSRFLYKYSSTVYENYLVNMKLDSKSLPSYYLTSTILPGVTKKKKIMKWLEGN